MRRTKIGHTVAALRSTLNLGQKELAGLVGCTFETIKSVELGRLKLSDFLALKISIETGVDPNWLSANNWKVPIKLTPKAMTLQEKAKIAAPYQYSRTTFELTQAHKFDQDSPGEILDEQLDGLMDLLRLRGIIESAREQHLYELARYKVDRFLSEMEQEFKSDPSERFLGGLPVNPYNGFKFAASEVETARLIYDADSIDPYEHMEPPEIS